MKRLENKILSVCLTIITPLVLMFGFYIQFHAKVSPGGGFQSGIVFAIPFVVYIMLYGEETKQGKFLVESDLFKNIACIGVMIYLVTGFMCNLFGGAYLEYSVFLEDTRLATQVGIFAVETGVCLTVFGSMTTVFLALYKYIVSYSDKHVSL